MNDQYKYCGLGRGRARVENFGFSNDFHPTEAQSMDIVDEEQSSHVDCMCRRPKKILFCKTCAYKGTGRLKIPCSIHPRNEMLMDMVCCPRCRTHISNMLEFDGDLDQIMQLQSNELGMETAENTPNVAENYTHTYVCNMHEFQEDIEATQPTQMSCASIEVANNYNKPLFGIGRGRGISPLKRFMDVNPPTTTNTPGMSPLKRENQSTSVFSRLSFPTGNEIRRPGNY